MKPLAAPSGVSFSHEQPPMRNAVRVSDERRGGQLPRRTRLPLSSGAGMKSAASLVAWNWIGSVSVICRKELSSYDLNSSCFVLIIGMQQSLSVNHHA